MYISVPQCTAQRKKLEKNTAASWSSLNPPSSHTPVISWFSPQSIESRLKVVLHEDLGSSLMDGVVLCHLANHIRPRSVGSIHVPSPAVVRLSALTSDMNVYHDLSDIVSLNKLLLTSNGNVPVCL